MNAIITNAKDIQAGYYFATDSTKSEIASMQGIVEFEIIVRVFGESPLFNLRGWCPLNQRTFSHEECISLTFGPKIV